MTTEHTPAGETGDQGENKGQGGEPGGKQSLGDVLNTGAPAKPGDTPAPGEEQFDLAHLPEDLRGDTADAALPKVWGKLQEVQTANEARGTRPERAEDYGLQLSEDTAKFFPDIENDPVIAATRKAALEVGMTTKEFGKFVPAIMDTLISEGVIEAPIDPKAEAEALDKDGQGKALFGTASDFITRIAAKGEGLKGDAKAEHDAIISEMKLNLETAAGVRMLNYLATKMGETGPGVPGKVQEGGQWTRESIREARKDPRYSTRSPQYDEAFRQRVDEANKALYRQ